MLLSYGLWQRKFGGDKDVLGTSIRLDGENYSVVGVMPAGVQLLIPKGSLTGHAPQLWLTIAWTQKSRTPRGRYMTAIARRRMVSRSAKRRHKSTRLRMHFESSIQSSNPAGACTWFRCAAISSAA